MKSTPRISDDSSLLAQDTSADPHVGQWRRLVSTTNWEKGRIISSWRESRIAEEARAPEYSDEAWARTVGGVTPQHVGRLRRVYDRFGDQHDSYEGLFWSHFHAALDWEDAEMWLEGAIQNRWSVSQMRRQRWETLGGDEPSEQDEVLGEIDEDLETDSTTGPSTVLQETLRSIDFETSAQGSSSRDSSAVAAPPPEPEASIARNEVAPESPVAVDGQPETPLATKPFAKLGTLPTDLAEAFESFKLAILRHKMQGWREVSEETVLRALEGLCEMTRAPTEMQA